MSHASGGNDQPQTIRWRVIMWLAIALLLVMPLIAMQFTNAVAWSVGDFIIAAVLLIGAGTLYEILSPKARRPAHRTVIAGVI